MAANISRARLGAKETMELYFKYLEERNFEPEHYS